MTDRANLRVIFHEAKTLNRLAKQPEIHRMIEESPRLEGQILRMKGNIRHIRVELKRLSA